MNSIVASIPSLKLELGSSSNSSASISLKECTYNYNTANASMEEYDYTILYIFSVDSFFHLGSLDQIFIFQNAWLRSTATASNNNKPMLSTTSSSAVVASNRNKINSSKLFRLRRYSLHADLEVAISTSVDLNFGPIVILSQHNKLLHHREHIIDMYTGVFELRFVGSICGVFHVYGADLSGICKYNEEDGIKYLSCTVIL